MKNRRERAKQVRQRKVAALAAYSRRHTVKNCTIPKLKQASTIDESGNGEWTIPDGGYKQPKTLHKKYKKKYYAKVTDGTSVRGDVWKVITQSSDYRDFPDHTPEKHGKAWFMEQVVQHKIAKWEKKNPCPVKPNQNPPDMFEEEYVIPWKARREVELERIRDFVVSVYDKLPLTGRFQKTDNDFTEEPVAEIKDIGMEGHKINELDPNKSKLLKKAQKVTNAVHAKRPNLVCTNLKDHKRQKGRILLPKAA